MRKAFEYLISGCIVYVVVAACSAGGGGSNGGTANNSGANNSTSGTASNVGGYGGLASNGGSTIDITAGVSGDSTAAGHDTGGTEASGGNGGSGGMLDQMMDPVPDAMAQSGTRLKARWIAGADGSKQFNGWRDTMLNIDCTFITTAKGLRCIPAYSSTLASYFADANCTTELAISACNGAGYTFSYDVATSCNPTAGKMFKVGAVYTGPMIYTKSGATCSGGPNTPGGAFSYYTLTEVDPATFAGGTETVDP